MNFKPRGFESFLAPEINSFLKFKRTIGRKYETEEWALHLLDDFLYEEDVLTKDELTPDVLDRFLLSRPRASPRSYNHLLGVLRRLFNWMETRDILDSSPLNDQPRKTVPRPPPFIFTKTQAKSLIKLASELPEVGRYLKLRGPTYQIVFILLYGLGLRVSEVCRIQFKDVDQDRHLLVIQQTKFAKNRLVPFGPRIGRVLTEFISLRQSNSINNHAPSDPLFSFTNNRPISRKTVGTVFRSLIFQLNIQPQPGSSSPRVHSLRHSFAVGRLLQWYHEGINPASRLLHLSTFLGHVSPESTAVYLTITGDLLEEAGKRFESFAYNTQEGASQ